MKSDVDLRKTTRQYRIVGWRQCSFKSVMKCDADIHENVLVSMDMSAVPAGVVVAKTSIEESSLQWRFVRQCHVDNGQEHITQSATKCDAGNRRNSHANRWSFLSPKEKFLKEFMVGFPTAIVTFFIFRGLASRAAQESIFSLRGVFLIVVQNVKVGSFYGGALVFRQVRGVSRWKYYGELFTAFPYYIALDFRGNTFSAFCFHPSGEQSSVFPDAH